MADGVPVCFTTDDGWLLEGTLWRGSDKGAPTVVLVHGLNEEHGAFGKLARDLAERGFTVLAFDSRGHGSSRITEGAKPRWPEFTDREYQSMYRDLVAAAEFLVDKDLRRPTVIVGSMLGANEALQYATSRDGLGLEGLLLLSPGVAYRGMTATTAFARLYEGDVLVVASADDTSGSRDAKTLLDAMPSTTKALKLWPSKGRGTRMLDDTEVRGALLHWTVEVTKNLPPARDPA
ncbi:MAG TPA: alpha/beta fold hydrolase [Candidatus Thermoplasmatota archaeon]|nr:alpha/beta fold hydrolase [Candidatus Thermoplasmatota archaeon]